MDKAMLLNLRQNDYESRLISTGNNYPDIDISKDQLNELCVLLHARVSMDEIVSLLSISEVDLMQKIDKLRLEGLVKYVNNYFLPTFPIVSEDDGRELYQLSRKIGQNIVKLICGKMHEIKEETYNIPAFQKFTFEELSLFMLSDVLLDNFQIQNVEKLYLKSEKPNRNNKHYFFALLAKNPNSSLEPFGIYGNDYRQMGKYTYCMYGNSRYNKDQFLTLSTEQLENHFNYSSINIVQSKELILDRIVEHYDGDATLPKQIQMGLEKLHLLYNEKLMLPILNENEYGSLFDIAGVIRDDLIYILLCYHNDLVNYFSQSLYAEETTYGEFFLWYYHFFYTFVTEELIKSRNIVLPKGQVFNYMIR
ncbi:hypothetical protein [Cytobacillus sp. IB215665]|uniref:hypothetical protein n=1 Tax=Cytobacillus sp. IB215665 TaxID=3097357 RepID=UPI002A0D4F55|nr:hypothetical protein [Cytobacillus sp. IB215665]MDX8366276.1 hypothetical protein [Cytobacillus sp. IB215665]